MLPQLEELSWICQPQYADNSCGYFRYFFIFFTMLSGCSHFCLAFLNDLGVISKFEWYKQVHLLLGLYFMIYVSVYHVWWFRNKHRMGEYSEEFLFHFWTYSFLPKATAELFFMIIYLVMNHYKNMSPYESSMLLVSCVSIFHSIVMICVLSVVFLIFAVLWLIIMMINVIFCN